MDRRLDVLTSLRFFASAMIVFAHFPIALDLTIPRSQYALGVSFFFVLSGFVLTWANSEGFATRRFYKKRALRLWPVHLITLSAIIAVQLYPNPLQRSDFISPLIANVFLLQAWIPTYHYVSANGVSWSISVEVFFYALFPLLVIGQSWKPAAIVSATVIALILFNLDTGRLHVVGKDFVATHMVLEWPPMRLLEFIIGIGTAKLFIAHRQDFDFTIATSFELLAVAVVILFGAASNHFKHFLPALSNTTLWLSQSGGVFIFAAALFVFAHQSGALSSILKWKAFVLLGEISFSTYMVHQIILKYVGHYHFVRQLGEFQTRILCLVVIYVASYLTWVLVERPCTNIGRKTPQSRTSPPDAVTAYLAGDQKSVMWQVAE